MKDGFVAWLVYLCRGNFKKCAQCPGESITQVNDLASLGVCAAYGTDLDHADVSLDSKPSEKIKAVSWSGSVWIP